MPLDSIISDCRSRMDRTIQYFKGELKGIRTGRASTALIDHVKVEYYGSPTDLKGLAAISTPEPTKLLVKPFDPQAKHDILKALEASDLGLNPQVDGDAIYVNVPPPSSERRKQLANQVKKMAEEARIALRNERRDAIKHLDSTASDEKLSDDELKRAKEKIEGMIKGHVKDVDADCDKKVAEIEEL